MIVSFMNSYLLFLNILKEASLDLIYNQSLPEISIDNTITLNTTSAIPIINFLKKVDNIISLNGLPTFDTVFNTLGVLITNYWENIQQKGFGVSQIDDFLVFFVVTRLILLSIRYNILTAFAMSAISITAAYVWYSGFMSTLFMYERILYRNSLTFRLGVDATQIMAIMRGKVQDANYRIRLSNPIGILGYAIINGSIHDGHHIDPLSMLISKAPERFWIFTIKSPAVNIYYLIYRKVIPMTLRCLVQLADTFITFGTYTFVTRVNKKYCPYLIRWHWTTLITMRFLEPLYCSIIFRLGDYAQNIIYPEILAAQQYNLVSSEAKFEFALALNSADFLIICHLGFMLYGMFHAVCGQYFYIPFFIKPIELHIGPRDKTTIYSGGNTAWQDSEEKPKLFFPPKLWYGWFGRGTKTPNLILYIAQRTFFKPIYRFIKRIFRIFWKN